MPGFMNFLPKFNQLDKGTIKFITGSRAKAEYSYEDDNSFKLTRPSLPGKPLHLTDFESVKFIAPGPLGAKAIVKCTFKNGEEATATVNFYMLEVLSIFVN